MPESKEELEISNTFSYKYNGIVKNWVCVGDCCANCSTRTSKRLRKPVTRSALHRTIRRNTGAEAAAKEDKTDQLRFNDIPDNNDARIKDTIVETKKSLYKINDPDGWTNMRESPNGKIMRTIDTLERFEIIGNNKNWMLIQLENKQKGFVHNSRIVIVD